MTEQELAVMEARTALASPGPWRACGEDHKGCACAFVNAENFPVASVTRGKWGDTWAAVRLEDGVGMGKVAVPFIDMMPYGEVSHEVATRNAMFIAHAREDVPKLIEEIRILKQKLQSPISQPTCGCCEE